MGTVFPRVLLLFVLVTLGVGVRAQTQGLGAIRFATSTTSPEAQAHFLRGLAWLHSFGYDEAIEEFRMAQQRDPAFAMAYWGEAMCHYRPVWRLEDLAAGREALAKLGSTREARAAKAPTERERAYLAAAEAVFSDDAKSARDGAFVTAMRDLASRYPEDVDAAVFAAFGLIGMVPPGVYDDPRLDEAGALAERAFAAQPQHPGAAHAVIHAYDDRDRAPRALAAARVYASLAPASSHARHMPAHIFVQLGMWAEAVASDQAAWQTSDAHVAAHGLPIAGRDYHPLSWLVYEYVQQGRFDRAREALKPLEDALAASPQPWMRNELATWRGYYIVGSGRWREVADRHAFDNADELFALGFAAARSGDLGKAAATLEIMEKVAATDSEPSRRQVAAIMERQLGAAVMAAQGQLTKALALAAEAAALEDKAPRSTGRPHPVKSSHELYGEFLLQAKRPREAMQQFGRALWRVTNGSSSVLGLARAAAAAGDRDAARRHYTQFLDNWKAADQTRPEIKEARTFLSVGNRQ